MARHEGNRGVRALSCDEQCRVLAFAQLTGRESLRDIEASLSPQSAKLHRIGICVRVILSGWSGDEIASSSGADYYSMLLRGGRWR